MAAKSGSGIEGHESKWFRFRGLDNFPNIYPHRAINHLKLVNQRDVDAPKNVLQQLGCFCHSTGGYGNEPFDRDRVQLCCLLEACGGKPPNNLRDGCYHTLRIPGVLALWRKGEMKPRTRFQV